MRIGNQTIDRFIKRHWKLPIFVFFLIGLGIFFSPADSAAQAPPPRSQGLQMMRPLVPPPETPVEREIRELKKEVEATTPAKVYSGQLQYLRRRLACYAQCIEKDGMICGRPIPFPPNERTKEKLRTFCNLRMKALTRQIHDMETRLTE